MNEKRSSKLTFILIPAIVVLLAATVVSVVLLNTGVIDRWLDGNGGAELPPTPPPIEQNGEDIEDPENLENFENYENNESYENVGPPNEPEEIDMLTVRERFDRIVWINAGGGGTDVGSEGVLNGVTHWGKDINLSIALKVAELFDNSDSGVQAFLLRNADLSFPAAERPAMWNDSADLVVSIHMNSFAHEDDAVVQGVSGFEVHFYENRTIENSTGRFRITSRQFAEITRNHMATETGARNRDIRSSTFTVIERSTMPAVLINAGFMSNQEELERLISEEYQQNIAMAIYNSVTEAFRFPQV